MKKLLGTVLLILAVRVTACAANFPDVGNDQNLTIDYYNSQLVQEEKAMLLIFALLFVSVFINLALVFLYRQFIVYNQEFDRKFAAIRIALDNLGEKAGALAASHPMPTDIKGFKLSFGMEPESELEFLGRQF